MGWEIVHTFLLGCGIVGRSTDRHVGWLAEFLGARQRAKAYAYIDMYGTWLYFFHDIICMYTHLIDKISYEVLRYSYVL